MTLKGSAPVALHSNFAPDSPESVLRIPGVMLKDSSTLKPMLKDIAEINIRDPDYSYPSILNLSETRKEIFKIWDISTNHTTHEVDGSFQGAYCFNQRPNTSLDKVSFRSLWPACRGELHLDRGRAICRSPRLSNPLERAESRARRDEATLELAVRTIRERYHGYDHINRRFNEQSRVFDEQYLEPFAHDPICQSVSEMIDSGPFVSRAGLKAWSEQNWPTYSDFDMFQNKMTDYSNMEVFFESNEPQEPQTQVEADVILRGSQDLGSTRHSTYVTLPGASLATFASAHTAKNALIPPEVIHQIYLNLSPVDFNSARHTCRSWYINSLERSLLQKMLKRGGWSTGIQDENICSHTLDPQMQVNDEWLMSKRIARECSLGPDWTGNGLRPTTGSRGASLNSDDLKATPFLHSSTTDFTETGVHYPGSDESNSGMIFTVSSCGRFLMVAHGCLVYIYELNYGRKNDDTPRTNNDGSLRPVTSIICPRRVLACSMDTSSHRYAIAVLLDGRMGLVSNLESLKDHSRHSAVMKYDNLQDTAVYRGNQFRNRVSISSSRSHPSIRVQTAQPFVFPVIAAEPPQSSVPIVSELDSWQDVASSKVSNSKKTDTGYSAFASPIEGGKNLGFLRGSLDFHSIHIESSPPTLYAPLCSADDLPRSVALCPQRQCVAFGCSSGIELHWVDALTGQDLSRWFPLTAPSDFLYFLPPRAGVDSAKKLRLISSAGRPAERSVIAEKFGSNKILLRNGLFWANLQSQYSDGWGGLARTNHTAATLLSRDMSDHYRAVPISDGYHVLFTDPSTEILCLGSDAPIGGPTKLIRKIWFVGPQGQGSAVAYTAASDLRWGVRVVAAYGHGLQQSIWLFSVPGDVFMEIQEDPNARGLPFAGISSGAAGGARDWVKWWCNAGMQDYLEPESDEADTSVVKRGLLWPLQVRGQEIGRCVGLVDLAIDGGPAMMVWAFSREGLAHTWQIDNGGEDEVAEKRFMVLRDGTVRETDADGDIKMTDAPSPVSSCQPLDQTTGHNTFDGTASLASSRILTAEKDIKGIQDPVNYDADGDVLMHGLSSDRERSASGEWCDKSFETVVQAHGCGDLLERSGEGSFIEEWGMSGGDVVDVLTGIARMDVEIH